MKVFGNYEIHLCTRIEGPDSPGKFYFEQCEPHEADVWTLYGHTHGEGVQGIGDFDTREHAEEVFRRITGIPFTGSREVMARLRMMHAGPALLDALKPILQDADHISYQTPHLGKDNWDEARSVVAQAEGRAA